MTGINIYLFKTSLILGGGGAKEGEIVYFKTFCCKRRPGVIINHNTCMRCVWTPRFMMRVHNAWGLAIPTLK